MVIIRHEVNIDVLLYGQFCLSYARKIPQESDGGFRRDMRGTEVRDRPFGGL